METQKTGSAHNKSNVRRLAEVYSKRYGISQGMAARLILKYLGRAEDRKFCKGWWVKLLDAQFQTHIGPYKRIRCGREKHLAHLSPDHGQLCHDCGCARGEYHVFGCDSEECSNCGEQAFCCDCT